MHRDRVPLPVRLLLRLYPKAYRERYADEVADFLRRERAESRAGPLFWLGAFVDHAMAARSVHARQRRGRMRTIVEDLRTALRALRRAPLFVTFAVGTLALGVGATASVYTLLDRVVLRPLPFEGSDRLVAVGSDLTHDPGGVGPLSPAMMRGFEDEPGPVELFAGIGGGSAILTGRGDPSRVDLSRSSRDYFALFEGRARVGRLFGPADHAAGAPRVAVLGHGFWTERFGADRGVVGTTLQLDDEPVTIVGVLGPDFLAPGEYSGGGDVWLPLDLRTQEPERGSFFLRGVARVRPGVTPDQLEGHIDGVTSGIYPPGDGPSFIVGATQRPLREMVVGEVGATLGRVMAAVALLLLIACVNVANLLLTRGAERVRELAVRTALGASGLRLVRQLLAESLLLALAGGALGGGLALGAVSLFRHHAPPGIPRLGEAFLDGRGFAFSLALGAATVLAFGLVPAWRAARVGTASASGTRAATHGRADGRLRAALVFSETALAVVLVVGSGLLATDLMRMAREDPGFDRAGLVSARMDLRGRPADEDDGARLLFWEQAFEAARALPGVTSATVSTELPYTDGGIVSINTPEGWDGDEGAWFPVVALAGDYLATMRMRLTAGRAFTGDEARPDGPMVAMVNEAFVRQYWPGEEGVGKTIKSGGPQVDDEGTYEVVGIVSDVLYGPGQDPRARMYVPVARETWRSMDVIVRTDGDAASLGPALRDMVRRLDPGLPVSRVSTVESLASASLSRPRFYTGLFAGFALVALLLAVVGVYGTTAYATRSRTREIGIRLALGAGRDRVVGVVVRRTGAVVLTGVAAGLAAAALSARLMADVLMRVDPLDLATYGAVGVLVLAAGVVAAWIPASRASRVDPASTLRQEA